MPFRNSKTLGGVSLLLIAVALSTCGCDRTPRSTAVKIMDHPPREFNRKYVEVFHVEVNGQDIEKETIRVTQGTTAQIRGSIVMTKDRIPAMKMVDIRACPEGSPDAAWDKWGHTMSWPGPVKEVLEYPAEVDAPPGRYDFRCYISHHHFEEDLPKFDLICKGKLEVLPAGK